MLKVLFFARLRDELGTASIEVEINDEINVNDLKTQLISLHPDWNKAISSEHILCAVNHQVVDGQHPIKQDDEVAFFPPVTGG